MSMIRKMTPVAIAIAALCSTPAFAGTAAAAGVDNSQSSSTSNMVQASGNTNSATLSNDVLKHASGNIGVNNAAGLSNQQANNTGIAMSSATGDANAAVSNAQSQGGSMGLSLTNVTNTANLNDDVLKDAAGNIGVNNAAGDYNQQSNGTAIAAKQGESNSASNANATVTSAQSIAVGRGFSFSGGSDNAELENHVLENATGNVGVNNAAGDNNQGTNALSIATADDGVASAGVSGGQSASVASYQDSGRTNASLENDVLEHASGNINVNNAAGTNNQQGNALAIAVTDDSLASASASSSQSLASMGGTSSTGVSNSASLSCDVLEHATGNIGVNNAAGGNNQQLNSLSIAASN